jgi:hypothetical protein
MAELFFGLTRHSWGIVGAFIIFFGWPLVWKWRGKDWFKDGLIGFYKIFYSEDDYDIEQHTDVIDLQSKYFGLVFFWVMYIPIMLIDLNLIGILGTGKTSQNIYIGGAGLTIASLLGGGAVVSYLMTGAKLLLTGAFGLGNFCEGYHPHEDHWAGWIKRVQLFSTIILTPDFGTLIIANSLLIEYRIKNYDRSPFYHETFEIEVTKESKRLVVGEPDITDAEGNVTREGAKSKILRRIEEMMGPWIISPSKRDRSYYEDVLPNMNWAAVSRPTCTLKDNTTAVLRFPVRNYLSGLGLRHEISRRNILDLSSYKVKTNKKPTLEKEKPKEVIITDGQKQG